MSEVKFLVSADLHYKKRMYATTVAQLEKIVQRAKAEKVELILHDGVTPEISDLDVRLSI